MNAWNEYFTILLTLTAVFVVWPTLKIIFTPELEPSGELMGMSGANVAGTLFKSTANGMINAFVTLRVGMTALKYLEEGSP